MSDQATTSRGRFSSLLGMPLLSAVAIAAIAGLITLIAGKASREDLDSLARQNFEARAAELHTVLEQRMVAYPQVLRSLQAMVNVNGHPTRKDWTLANQTLQVERNFPGLTGTVYIRPFSSPERADALQSILSFEPGFAIKPPGDRDHYAVVTSVEPRTPSNLPVIGSDSWAHPQRRASLEEARDTGEIRITPKLTLVIDDKPTPAFLMYQAIYQGGFIPETQDERRRLILGYATAGCRVEVLMRTILPADLQDVAVRVHDGNGETPDSLYFASHPRLSPGLSPHMVRRELAIGGRNWTIIYEAIPKGVTSDGQEFGPNMLIFGGLGFSVLLGLLTWSQLSTRARAAALAGEMTRSLRASEERFRELAETIDQVFFVATPDYSRIDYVSPSFDRIWGHPGHEIADDPTRWVTWVHPEDREDLVAFLTEHRFDAEYAREFRIIRADGTVRWLLGQAYTVHDSSGAINHVVGIHSDITERKAAEARIAALLDEKAVLLDNTVVGIYTTEQRRVKSCNRHFLTMFGYGEDEVVGASVRVFYADDESFETAGKALYEDIARKGEAERDVLLRRKDGSTFWGFISGRPLDASRNKPDMVWMMVDITSRKEAEERLLRTNLELEQFAYVASHDLQTPLRNVVSYSQLLARRYAGRLDADAEEFINYIVNSGTHMSSLIRDLLQFSRLSHRNMMVEPVELNMAADQALTNLGSLAADVEIRIDALPRVNGEASQLTSLFQNLIGNAVKYRAANRPARISVTARQQDAMWIIAVADNGIGIQPQYVERIFEIFQRLHSADSGYEGTGIGLAICKRVVAHHGGRIWVESVPGEGSTFFFTLPVTFSTAV